MEQASEIKLSVLSGNIYELARILLNPTRLEILKIIAKKEKCHFNDIFIVISLAQSTLSTHIVELIKIGLIFREYDRRRTICPCQAIMAP
jgi:DNA-binding transcriptional ArsR family regulator